ncbi:craniofacial development protein 1-like [Antedon mediterranea]|uniref:craniofacial development protein 1-like n=1 Tax=Antedon mediterranea TaxID=105859 RepID=UPI003AF9D800
MSDSESNYDSGEDDDYIPSDDQSDDNDGKYSSIKGVADADTENIALVRKRKKKNSNKSSISFRKKGINVDDDSENSEEEEILDVKIKQKDDLELGRVDNMDKKTDEKKKEKADDLWNSFLKDVGQPSDKKKESVIATSSTTLKDVPKYKAESVVTVTKLFDFAGETIEVKEEVKAKEADKYQKTTAELNKPTTSSLGIKRSHGGLGNLLNTLTKKPKISTLEKSKLDWNSFKQQEGIEEDLKLHNKGKNGFLEKKDFLDRTNERQYEIEKSFRLGLKKSTR